MKNRWLKYSLIYTAILLLAAGSLIAFDAYRLFYKPMLTGDKPVIITIDKSVTASSVVSQLKEKKLIESKRLILGMLYFKGWSAKIKAGIYEIEPGESSYDFFSRVVDGDVLKESFSIIEGTTKAQIEINLQQAPYLNYQSADWFAITNSYSNPEGLLLADTYFYDAGTLGKDLLLRAHLNLNKFLEQSWKNRDSDLPYKSSYELLITASILEKEAALAKERRLIAGVIVNRLRKNMPLQMDPTIIYALGPKYQGTLSHQDMQVESPYNSYLNRGLPPTPIAMVGKDAIEAAAHPEKTKFLYFVAKGDGSHHFSATYDQQKEAINFYLKKKK